MLSGSTVGHGAGRKPRLRKSLPGGRLFAAKGDETAFEDAPLVLLVSSDSVLIHELERLLAVLGMRVKAAMDIETGMEAMEQFGFRAGMSAGVAGMESGVDGTAVGRASAEETAVILLDARLSGVANGRLLAAVEQSGVHKRCAVALVAEQVSDSWLARLREGVIDDIVPRHADISTWRTHISTMQRGHALARELEQLREMAMLEVEYDRVTRALNKEAMLALLFKETDRVQRLDGVLTLLMIELDPVASGRKGQTGLIGEEGNELVREVAARISRLLRSYDVLGRMREDRFLVLLPGCSVVNAATLADRIRMEVFGELFFVGDGAGGKFGTLLDLRVTARYSISASRGRSPLVVLREAEERFIEAQLDEPKSLHCIGELPGEAAIPLQATSNEETALYPQGEMFAC